MDQEIYRWLNGECGSYAYALVDAAFEDGVELNIGINRNSFGGIEHVFAYQEDTAYDALGAHPLPYRAQPEWSCETDLPKDIVIPFNEELIEEALPHALSIWEDER